MMAPIWVTPVKYEGVVFQFALLAGETIEVEQNRDSATAGSGSVTGPNVRHGHNSV
jgi:hypothetical protein